MTPYAQLPNQIIYNGEKIVLTLYYDRVLEAMDVLRDDTFSTEEKLDYTLYLLAVDAPCEVALLRQILELIFPGQKPADRVRYLDIKQDWPLIYAGFWQAYGLDLYAERGKLHYLKFRALLQGLPKSTRLADVIRIRTMPIPKPTPHNAKERAEIIRLKHEFRIRYSEEEQEQNFQNGLRRLAQFLTLYAER